MDHTEYVARLTIERVTHRVKASTAVRRGVDSSTERTVRERTEIAAFTLADSDIGSLSARMQGVMNAALPYGPMVIGTESVVDDEEEEEDDR